VRVRLRLRGASNRLLSGADLRQEYLTHLLCFALLMVKLFDEHPHDPSYGLVVRISIHGRSCRIARVGDLCLEDFIPVEISIGVLLEVAAQLLKLASRHACKAHRVGISAFAHSEAPPDTVRTFFGMQLASVLEPTNLRRGDAENSTDIPACQPAGCRARLTVRCLALLGLRFLGHIKSVSTGLPGSKFICVWVAATATGQVAAADEAG
jgi:hypothetical protein